MLYLHVSLEGPLAVLKLKGRESTLLRGQLCLELPQTLCFLGDLTSDGVELDCILLDELILVADLTREVLIPDVQNELSIAYLAHLPPQPLSPQEAPLLVQARGACSVPAEVAVGTLLLARQILVAAVAGRPSYRLRSRACQLEYLVPHVKEDLLGTEVNHVRLFLDLAQHGNRWRLLEVLIKNLHVHLHHLESAC